MTESGVSLLSVRESEREADRYLGVSEGIEDHGGLRYGELIVIGAETSQGKTSLANTLASYLMKIGLPTLFFSLEMSQKQQTARVLGAATGVPVKKLLECSVNRQEWEQLKEKMMLTSTSQFFINDDSCIDINEITALTEAMVASYGIKGIFIDYLQILAVNESFRGNTEMFFGDISRKLKNLAKRLNIFIVVLSQMNRDKNSHRPSIDRLRASGQIAEAADQVITIYRPDVYNEPMPAPFQGVDARGKAVVKCHKGRNSGTWELVAEFDKNTVQFNPCPTVKLNDEIYPF